MSRAETEHQRELLEAVILSQEKERRRIGMNLHDDVGAALSVLRMTMESDALRTGTAAIQSKAIIDRVMTDVRNISHDLFPMRSNAYTFTDAIADRCEALNAAGQIRVDLAFVPDADSIVPGETEAMAMYRVVSELINNTLRHADAKNIHIHFSLGADTLSIQYRDDGKGMGTDAGSRKGMGMQNIESRLNMIGASFRVTSEPGAGFGFFIECAMHSTLKTV